MTNLKNWLKKILNTTKNITLWLLLLWLIWGTYYLTNWSDVFARLGSSGDPCFDKTVDMDSTVKEINAWIVACEGQVEQQGLTFDSKQKELQIELESMKEMNDARRDELLRVRNNVLGLQEATD